MSADSVSHLKVLIVDDDPAVARFLKTVLADLGIHDVRTADNGAAALEVDVGLASGINLIVSDLQMPKLDGIAYMRHLKALGYQGAVLLVSGADSRLLKAVEGLATAQGLNVLGVLGKPVRRAELARALGNLRAATAGATHSAGIDVSADELRLALEARDLDAWFQPQADSRSGRLLGAEALARWAHREKGLISPSTFIPLAEENGLIDALADQMLVKAMTAASAWRSDGFRLNVSVNLSFRNLSRLDLPERIEEKAVGLGLPLEALVLEVTESSVVTHLSTTLEILMRLRLKGVGLSIDDFGTGYSTLDNLKQIPFTELKIDRGFVNSAPKDRTAHTILESSIFLAHRLGMTTVAEGVETPEERALVVELGGDAIQGYSLARPMPKDQFLTWLRAYRPGTPSS
ncbi:MAG: EAL domain-containing protein [Thermoanaerobaculia bacterium]